MFQANQQLLLTLDSYDVIHYYSDQSSLSSSDDESGVIAPLKSFNAYQYQGGAADNFSASENVFPTLFKNGVASEAAPTTVGEQSQNLLLQGPLPYNVNDDAKERTSEITDNVYRKVADWVQSQQLYFSHREASDLDDIEVIDPVDLFHDSLLNDYLLLTESESEKRGLLRHLSSHRYNIESLQEALRKYEYEFVRSPRPKECMELNVMTKQGVQELQDSKSASGDSLERAFVGLNSILEKYYILNEEGQERFDVASNDEDYIISTNCFVDHETPPSSVKDWRSSIMTDVENISTIPEPIDLSRCVNFKESDTATTEIAHSVITVIHGNGSDDGSEVWEDAKDIPHWLDGEQEEVFTQPHRPLYYYRDRVKGCYRIVGVEDDTVILFSGNDDDSIFYKGKKETTMAEDHHEDKPMELSDASQPNAPLHVDRSGSLTDSSLDSSEKKSDSGIEDMEDIVNEYALVSISAREAALASYGFRSGQLQTYRHKLKSARFSTCRLRSSMFEYVFIFAGAFLFAVSLAVSIYVLITDTATL